MLEQPQPEQQLASAPATPKRNWIAIVIGGSCALLICLGLAAALVVTFLAPTIAKDIHLPPAVGNIVPSAPPDAPVGPSAAVIPMGAANALGDPNAPVKIIEYADFQCPYCRRFAQDTEPQIINAYVKTGKAYFEYRSVGAFLGPESGNAAEAAYCAGDQGKFWEYHDALFAHWTGENVGDFTPDKLKSYASALGLNQSKFDSCLDGAKYAARLEQDVASAQQSGIHATPSFLINGKLLEGAQPFAVFQQAIDAALKGP